MPRNSEPPRDLRLADLLWLIPGIGTFILGGALVANIAAQFLGIW